MKCILKSAYVDIISPQIYCSGPTYAGYCDYSNSPKPIPLSLSGSSITWDAYIAGAHPSTKIMPILTRTCASTGSIYSNEAKACSTTPSPYNPFEKSTNQFATYFCNRFALSLGKYGFFWYPYFA
jgi:hypothetical protein